MRTADAHIDTCVVCLTPNACDIINSISGIVHMSTCSVTRARRSCLVIGDSGTLRQDECCSSLWQYCSTRGAVMSASRV